MRPHTRFRQVSSLAVLAAVALLSSGINRPTSAQTFLTVQGTQSPCVTPEATLSGTMAGTSIIPSTTPLFTPSATSTPSVTMNASLEATLQSPSVIVTAKDNCQTIALKQGDVLQVSLDGIPSTGFTWEVAAVDVTILRAVGTPQFTASKALPGAPGTISLMFEAIGRGQTDLTLIYHRPFEKTVPPTNTFRITIVVR